VRRLAEHSPSHIYFSGRNKKEADALISSLKSTNTSTEFTFIECDLTSFDSIKACVEHFHSERLDIFICNAGVMAIPPGLTKDGYEIQFGINVIGHALLLKLLLPTLLHTADDLGGDVRVVMLTSLGFRGHPSGGIIFDKLRTTQECISPVLAAWIRYGQSKLGNLLLPFELARRYPQITSVSVHPGVIHTGLVENLELTKWMFVKVTTVGMVVTIEEGAYNTLWAATTKKENLRNGEFYEPVGVIGRQSGMARNEKVSGELWTWLEKELDGYLSRSQDSFLMT
jgi:NAD(P)-dependent dehydrogenase (short-subunit alcohol dehydrogenase family)